MQSDRRAGGKLDYSRRFGGVARLYGESGLAALGAARVCVVGVGGVGSWAVEALARSAVGNITLIDMDHVAESNINRQLPAIETELGRAKVGVLRERIATDQPRLPGRDRRGFRHPRQPRCDDRPRPRLGDGLYRQLPGQGGPDSILPSAQAVGHHRRWRRWATRRQPRTSLVICAGPSRIPCWPGPASCCARTMASLPIPSAGSTFPACGPTSRRWHRRPGVRSAPEGSLNCAGYGACMPVTATFGLVAAGHVINQLVNGR